MKFSKKFFGGVEIVAVRLAHPAPHALLQRTNLSFLPTPPHPSPLPRGSATFATSGRHLLPQGEKGSVALALSPIVDAGDWQRGRRNLPSPLVGKVAEPSDIAFGNSEDRLREVG